MKLYHLYETQDYGSRFLDQRDHVNALEAKLSRLREELIAAQSPADLRDLGSDKDRGGGVKYILQAIEKVGAKLIKARARLEELRELWELTRPKDEF